MSDARSSSVRSAIREPGPWLAHYTTAAAAFEHIIPAHQLRMSPYRLMRDPAENKDLLPGASFVEKRENPVQDWLAAVRTLKEARDRIRLLSLTQDVQHDNPLAMTFGCCWARPRLWEQYADAHCGVCLVFNRDGFQQTVQDALGNDRVSFGAVEYTPAGIALSAATFINLGEDLMNAATREQAMAEYLVSHRQDLFFLKTDDWASEHEFRAVLAGNEDEYAFADYGGSLVAVVLGEKFLDWQVAGAREVCDKAGVILARVRWNNGYPYAGEA